MPLKNGNLTPREQAFVDAYAVNQDRVTAEKAAGLRPRGGYDVLARPEIQAAIARRISAELHDLGTLAAAKIRHLVTSDKVPANVAFQAAKYTLDRIEGIGSGGAEKELHEMDAAELSAAIGRLEERAAALAKPVGDTPDQAPRTIDRPGLFD